MRVLREDNKTNANGFAATAKFKSKTLFKKLLLMHLTTIRGSNKP